MTDHAASSGPVVVALPPALTRLFAGAPERVEIEATSVGALIDGLDRRWPGMRDRLCDTRPRIRRNINVFVGGARATLDTPLAPSAIVTIKTGVIG